MFKVYTFRWRNRANVPEDVKFYLQRKARPKGGFFYRARAIGNIPRLDDLSSNYARYMKNNEKLESSMRIRRPSAVEQWPGRSVLSELWDKLAKLSFVDMGQICIANPFLCVDEPAHENLIDPNDIF